MLLAHTPKTRRGKKSKKGKKRERENRVSTEEKMDGVKKERQERKREGGRVCPRKSHVTPRRLPRRDLLCHVSVTQQPVWSESDTTSLDIPRAVSLSLADPREEQQRPHMHCITIRALF